jgi:hypothetical protein
LEGLVGLDFLKKRKAKIDMGSATITFPKQEKTVELGRPGGYVKQATLQSVLATTTIAVSGGMPVLYPETEEQLLETADAIYKVGELCDVTGEPVVLLTSTGSMMREGDEDEMGDEWDLPGRHQVINKGDETPCMHPRAQRLLEKYNCVLTNRVEELEQPAKVTPVAIRQRSDCVGPVHVPAYRVPMSEREWLQKEVTVMQQAGIISESTSPFSAPALVVPKKDGKFRLVIDYRKLNATLEMDASPIPVMDEILDQLSVQPAETAFWSKLDLKAGYWQIPLEEGAKKLTAFSTPDGHYQYERLPMGVSVAPAVFNTAMRGIFVDMPFVAIYFDDLSFGAATLEDHEQQLERVFQRLAEKNLKLNKDKSLLFQTSIPLLGFLFGRDGLRPDPEKMRAIEEMMENTPSTVKELQRVIGLCSYYRRYIKDFADIAGPLYALISETKGKKLEQWEKAHAEAYTTLLQKLIEPGLVLALPDFSGGSTFVLETDASGVAIGAVLQQLGRPICYASRRLSKHERHYGISELECLAVVWAVKLFRLYLLGRKFTVVTDHAALQWLLKLKDPVGRLARWAVYLQVFDMEITYRKARSGGGECGRVESASG